MNIFDTTGPTLRFGQMLDKMEDLRRTLRWTPSGGTADWQALLAQCNAVHDDMLELSRKERFVQTWCANGHAGNVKSLAQRRQALLDRGFVFSGTFGENRKLLDALEAAEKAAPTELPVLIDGESGTGKELLAQVIHANGDRADRPYISVNCGAIPENLLESELFGHRKGAFSGATSDRKGKFESAHGGTIFLDEIGDLPLAGQVKLLRVLESNEIQRVGADAAVKVDARVVAATNKDLRKLVSEGTFRDDLFYRLSVIHVTMPPLRERNDELTLLLNFFVDEAADKLRRRPVEMTARLRTFLASYDYPGNVRELRNIVYCLSCLAGETADLVHLPEYLRPDGIDEAGETNKSSVPVTLYEAKKVASDAAEKTFLEKGLQEVGGKVIELARRNDMNRSHLQSLLKKHGLRSKDYRAKPVNGEAKIA